MRTHTSIYVTVIYTYMYGADGSVNNVFFLQIRPFVLERLADFSGSEDKDSFFTPAERGHVLLSCLESVKHDKVL